MKKIILDCDTGQDDAIAIVLAIASKELEVKGITTVGGNANVDRCAKNTLKILELMNVSNVPVYLGEQHPLYKELKTLPEVFGESGMAGGDDLPIPILKTSDTKAKDFIIDTFSQKTDLIVCATAPMTNYGKALLEKPSIADRIITMTIMGGCPFPEPIAGKMGNITINEKTDHKAEYNCWTDPDAFAIVVEKIKNINLVGLNITKSILYNHIWEKKLKDINTTLSKRVAKILSAVGKQDEMNYANQKAFPGDPVRAIHDVIAVAYEIDKSMFKSEIFPLKVELEDENKKGQTLIDKNGKPVNIIMDLDRSKFFDLFMSTIEGYGK